VNVLQSKAMYPYKSHAISRNHSIMLTLISKPLTHPIRLHEFAAQSFVAVSDWRQCWGSPSLQVSELLMYPGSSYG